jgi:hypothetical protein
LRFRTVRRITPVGANGAKSYGCSVLLGFEVFLKNFNDNRSCGRIFLVLCRVNTR